MTKKTIDCDDPKNKDNALCDFSKSFAEIIGFPALVVIMTLGVWLLGAIIIAVVWHHVAPEHKIAVIVVGIAVCILIAPVSIVVLQKLIHWPLQDLDI